MPCWPSLSWSPVFTSLILYDISTQKINTVIKVVSLLLTCPPEHLPTLLTFIIHLLCDRDCTKFGVNEKKIQPLFSNYSQSFEGNDKLTDKKIRATLDSSTSWQIDDEKAEAVADFIFWSFKIAVDGDCSHEIKRCLLLRGKVMTNLDSMLKSRDVTLPTKVHLVKAMVVPVVMYG